MKRWDKYKCKYDKQWLLNRHEGYVCPECGVIYKEIPIKIDNVFYDTYLEELKE